MQNKSNYKLVAHMVAIITAIVWGTTFISTKVLLASFSPIEIVIYRFVIGYLVLWLIKPKFIKFQGIRKEFWYLLAGFSGVTIYFLCENVSLTMTSAGNVGIIVSTAPMFTALFAFLALKTERPSRYFWIGFFLAITGIALINLNGSDMGLANVKGDILALFAAAVWGVYSVILRKYINTKEDVILNTRRVLFYGILTMIPCGMMMGTQFDTSLLTIPVNAGNLIFLGILATAMGYVMWNFALEHLGVMQASAYIYIVPVITIITSGIILSENITLQEFIGCILTVAGLFLSEKRKK